jgi:hypothetical protein
MQWQKRIYQHEESPPPDIWEEIRKQVEAEPIQLGQAIYDHSEPPPPELWETIHSVLSTEHNRNVVPLPKVSAFGWIRSHAAAIISIGVLLTALVYLLTNTDYRFNPEKLATGVSYTDSPSPTVEPGSAPATNQESPAIAEDTGGNSDEKPAITATVPEQTESAQAVKSPVSGGPESHPPASAEKQTQRTEYIPGPLRPGAGLISYRDGNYIVVERPDGTEERVSYKLEEMVRVANATDKLKTKQYWNRQIREWQAKMDQSSVIPSASNFFDIAELARFLNEQ